MPAQPQPGSASAAVPDSAPAVDRPRSRFGWLGRYSFSFWPVLCFFQAGLLAGFWWMLSGQKAMPEHPAAAVASVAPPEADKHNASAIKDAEPPNYELGQKHLVEGNFAAALPHFWPEEPDKRDALPDQMQFRAAICLEGLGRWQEALAAYRAAAARTSTPCVSLASAVAQARVWTRRDQPAEAKALLYPLLLQADRPECRDNPAMTEARYLLALILSQEALREQRLAGADETLVRVSQGSWPVAHSLSWLVTTKTAGEPWRAADISVLQQYGARPEEVLLRGGLPRTSMTSLLEKLAALGQLKVEWSPSARERAQGRTAQLALDGVPLLEVVQALLEPLGLAYTLQEQRLRVISEAEAPADVLTAMRTAAARQALRAAVFADPRHGLAARAYLELANDEAAQGKLNEAVSWYNRLLAETPRATQVAAAFFNLGLVQIAQRDYAAARHSLYHVIDGFPEQDLACRAYLQVGRTHLLEGEPAKGLFPLRRALGFAAGKPARPEAVMTLAAALLLTGKAREANEVLAKEQQEVNHDAYRAAAAFFDALARFRVAAESKNSRLESADLLAAALAFQKQPMLGMSGQLLVGQGYKEVGMAQQMAAVYEQALKTATGPVADEMTFELADHLLANSKRDRALKLLQGLATSSDGKWTQAARLRLATVALQDGNHQQCLGACRQCLENARDADRIAVLQLMGTAYEQLGDYEKAASCFRGQMPPGE